MSGRRPFAELKEGWSIDRRALNAARKALLQANLLAPEKLNSPMSDAANKSMCDQYRQERDE
jgi:hypothetical protein